MDAASSGLRLSALDMPPDGDQTETQGKRKRSLAEASLRNLQPRKQCPQCGAQHGNAKKGECGGTTPAGACTFVFQVKKNPRQSSNPTLVSLPTANRPLKSVQAHFARLVHDADAFAAKWGMSVGVLAAGAVHTSHKATEYCEEVATPVHVHGMLMGQPRLKVVALKHATGGSCGAVVNSFQVLDGVCRGVQEALEAQQEGGGERKGPDGAFDQEVAASMPFPTAPAPGGYPQYFNSPDGGDEDGVEDHWDEDFVKEEDIDGLPNVDIATLESIFCLPNNQAMLNTLNIPSLHGLNGPQLSPSTSTTHHSSTSPFEPHLRPSAAPPALNPATSSYPPFDFSFPPDTPTSSTTSYNNSSATLAHSGSYTQQSASLSQSLVYPQQRNAVFQKNPSLRSVAPDTLSNHTVNQGSSGAPRLPLHPNYYMSGYPSTHRPHQATQHPPAHLLMHPSSSHIIPTAVNTDDMSGSNPMGQWPRLRNPHT